MATTSKTESMGDDKDVEMAEPPPENHHDSDAAKKDQPTATQKSSAASRQQDANRSGIDHADRIIEEAVPEKLNQNGEGRPKIRLAQSEVETMQADSRARRSEPPSSANANAPRISALSQATEQEQQPATQSTSSTAQGSSRKRKSSTTSSLHPQSQVKSASNGGGGPLVTSNQPPGQTTGRNNVSSSGASAPAWSSGMHVFSQFGSSVPAASSSDFAQRPQQPNDGAHSAFRAPENRLSGESSTGKRPAQQQNQNQPQQGQQFQLTPQQQQVMDRIDLKRGGKLSATSERIRHVYTLRLRWNHQQGLYMQEQTNKVFLSVSAAEDALTARIREDQQLRGREVKLVRRLLDGTGLQRLYQGQYGGEFWRVDAEVVQMAVAEEGGEVMWLPKQGS